jgi:hypothetical protein
MRKTICTLGVLLLLATAAVAQGGSSFRQSTVSCDDRTGIFCTEVYQSIGYHGAYTGHDEPSVLFYSDAAVSGNTMVYLLQLPKDPPKLPTQGGTGGTFNFQLHPAFWFGMAMCDDQSAPNPGGSSVGSNILCTPDSDLNIFDGTDSTASDFIGKHPGTGFMEMQFYPPGWFSSFCPNADRWCSALNIDSLSENQNTGLGNNAACGGTVEYVNFAFITKSGIPTGPPGPLFQNHKTFTPNADTLFYNSGDVLQIVLRDTAHGLKVTITDLTTGESGSMTASAANGFAEILYDPTGTNCNRATHNIPYDFHPRASTRECHGPSMGTTSLSPSSTAMRSSAKGEPALRMVFMTWITAFPRGRRMILGALRLRLPVFSGWCRLAAAPRPISTLMEYRISWSGRKRSGYRYGSAIPCASRLVHKSVIYKLQYRSAPKL